MNIKYGQDIVDKLKKEKEQRIGKKIQSSIFANFVALHRLNDLKAYIKEDYVLEKRLNSINRLLDKPNTDLRNELLNEHIQEAIDLLSVKEDFFFDNLRGDDEVYSHQRISNNLDFQEKILGCTDDEYLEVQQVVGAYFLNKKKSYRTAKNIIIENS